MRARTTTRLPDPPNRPFPVATQTRDGEPYEDYHPREHALRHLRELLAAGRAGLDPDDSTVLILDVLPHEQVWARSVVELTGLHLSEIPNAGGMGCRYRMIVEADIRLELGLDRVDAPKFAVGEAEIIDIFEAVDLAQAEARLDHPDTPVLRAIADARAAQQRRLERQVH